MISCYSAQVAFVFLIACVGSDEEEKQVKGLAISTGLVKPLNEFRGTGIPEHVSHPPRIVFPTMAWILQSGPRPQDGESMNHERLRVSTVEKAADAPHLKQASALLEGGEVSRLFTFRGVRRAFPHARALR